jgi:hypothetical protein
MFELPNMNLDDITHVIQTSLTPIFLLSAVATLLGTFTTRLARISDQVNALRASSGIDDEAYRDRRLRHLRSRSHALDLAVVLAAVAGACTCVTVLTLFLGALRAKATAALLFVLFGTAICLTIGALVSFLTEMLMASRGIRAEVDRGTDEAERRAVRRETSL